MALPDWFKTLNRDFRYQLTPIGAPGPNLYIAQEVQGNRFQIAGGSAGLEVSWQVTGIRQDAWANAHRIPVEEAKPAADKGTYLRPELFGQPAGMGLDARLQAGRRLTRAAAPIPIAANERPGLPQRGAKAATI